MKKDLFFMQRALKQAKDAAVLGEVPVGAVLTLNDDCLLYTSPSPRDS